jgi:hypothetical protein
MRPLLIITAVVGVTGCTRFGFESHQPSIDGGTATDTIATGDLSLDDFSIGNTNAGLNEPCTPTTIPCSDDLVCAGNGIERYCRPPCGAGNTCPAGQTCGRLIVGGTTDPTAPMACFPKGQLDDYESCPFGGCKPGLDCLKGHLDQRICLSACTTDSDCMAGQDCDYAASSTVRHCMYRCVTDNECPGETKCVGFGTPPNSHCVPLVALGPYAACSTTEVNACPPGFRCTGLTGQTYRCYPVCSETVSCAAGSSCVTVTATASHCFKECDPLDNPSRCNADETCYVDAQLLKAYCVPGKGDPASCATTICETGKICADQSKCFPACDSKNPCKTGKCTELKAGTVTAPWKACI